MSAQPLQAYTDIDLRAFAREWDGGCLVRVPGRCNWDPTCLAHLRIANVAGVGQKPPNFCGVISCDACHSILDRRAGIHEYDYEQIRSFAFDALVRTLAAYENAGLQLIRGN